MFQGQKGITPGPPTQLSRGTTIHEYTQIIPKGGKKKEYKMVGLILLCL
jgi:hypothetical protein